MSASFDPSSLEYSYAVIEECPEHLLNDIVTLPIGTLRERVEGVIRWRDALLRGQFPPDDGWPPLEISAPIRKSLAELDLVRFCKDQPELVDALMKDFIGAFARQTDLIQSTVATRLRELEKLEREQCEKQARAKHSSTNRQSSVKLDRDLLARLRAQAMREVQDQEFGADSLILDNWSERVRAWSEIAEVFGDLGEMMGRGWDLSRGVLRHTGWLDLLRLRQLIEQLPQLREIVRALGRLHAADDGESTSETIFSQVSRIEQERREIRTPLIPAEIRGLERSGEISRMLPVEALMLGHPKLRMLWHARRSERALLTYRVEGVEVETVEREQMVSVESSIKRPRPIRGPILAVVDTSGSMHGLPEQVAKALALEALRTAHAEKRRCYLYAYSGPSQVMEHELALSADGIGKLLQFLGFSFGGGNDEAGLMAKVINRLEENDWAKADVVFVSDGEWPASSELIASVAKVRGKGTRFHGIQIGNRGRTGLHAVCDPVHVFTDWTELGRWR